MIVFSILHLCENRDIIYSNEIKLTLIAVKHKIVTIFTLLIIIAYDQ